ncbi:MAG: LysM peptidoglycan-binding domain-containing protein [Clostridia bacterium]|nr:LysM peptidoglycan-binding domain-containing protein [Clostridia bacterium]
MSIKKKHNPFYKVKSYDTLKSISEKFNITPTEILIENSISPKQITEGTILYIKNDD